MEPREISNIVYMIAYKQIGSTDVYWYCTGSDGRPFTTFNSSAADREVTKLRKRGYKASKVYIRANIQSCLIDLKGLSI